MRRFHTTIVFILSLIMIVLIWFAVQSALIVADVEPIQTQTYFMDELDIPQYNK